MSIHLYRYGEACGLPGLSLGVARFLPRQVKKEDYARRGYFDIWLPLLAPGRELVAAYRGGKIAFAAFAARYRREMKQSEPAQVIRLLAALAKTQRINLGCFCAEECRCHRSVLRALILAEQGDATDAERDSPGAGLWEFSSPPCFLAGFENDT